MGITINIRGTEFDLQQDGDALNEIMDTLTPEEEEDAQRQIMNALGAETEEQMEEVITTMQANLEDEDFEELTEQPIMPPFGMNLQDYNTCEFTHGIKLGSEVAGEYTALVNAGLTGKQAFELIVDRRNRAHEMEIANKQLETQIRIKELEIDTQLKINGLKSLLTEE